jgi:hypothetical protein
VPPPLLLVLLLYSCKETARWSEMVEKRDAKGSLVMELASSYEEVLPTKNF